ncbi:MAG: sigma factor [Bacteroidota bacterium]
MPEIRKQHNITESQIIDGLVRRDEYVFELLYDNYASSLLGAIMRIIKNKDHAEEVLQDTFVKVWQKIDTYSNTKGRLYTWMFNIARNNALDKLKSKEYSQMSVTGTIENTHNPDNT